MRITCLDPVTNLRINIEIIPEGTTAAARMRDFLNKAKANHANIEETRIALLDMFVEVAEEQANHANIEETRIALLDMFVEVAEELGKR